MGEFLALDDCQGFIAEFCDRSDKVDYRDIVHVIEISGAVVVCHCKGDRADSAYRKPVGLCKSDDTGTLVYREY